MSLMSFVTGAASLFGGSDKGSSSSTNQYSSGKSEQAATASEESTKTGKQTQTSSGTSTSTGSTTQTGTATGTESSKTVGQTTNYSSDVLASLDALLTQQLGAGNGVGSAQQASDALAGRLQQIQELAAKPAFDVEGYASGITEAATAATQNDLDSRINSILSATGSSESGNSMSALLGNKLRNDAAANLAGISANARATGEQLATQQQQSITDQIGNLSGGLSSQLINLLGAAKGGAQSTVGSATGTSTQANQQTGTTQSTTKENISSTGTTTETGKTSQSGITQATEEGKVSQKGSVSENEGDLFNKILKAFGSSAAAA